MCLRSSNTWNHKKLHIELHRSRESSRTTTAKKCSKKSVVHVQSCCLRLYSKPIAFLSFPSRKRLYTLSSPCRSRFEVTLNLVILRRSLKDDKQTYKKVMHLPFFCFELFWKPIKGITRKYLGFLMYLWMSFLKWGYTTSGSNQHCKAHLPGTILCLGTKFYSWIRST